MASFSIIISKFPFYLDLLEQYKCGIAVAPTNPAEIASAINYLISNQHIALEMGRNGHNAIKKRLNWGREEKKLINFYNMILSE